MYTIDVATKIWQQQRKLWYKTALLRQDRAEEYDNSTYLFGSFNLRFFEATVFETFDLENNVNIDKNTLKALLSFLKEFN